LYRGICRKQPDQDTHMTGIAICRTPRLVLLSTRHAILAILCTKHSHLIFVEPNGALRRDGQTPSRSAGPL
jgi:hypothetical protein